MPGGGQEGGRPETKHDLVGAAHTAGHCFPLAVWPWMLLGWQGGTAGSWGQRVLPPVGALEQLWWEQDGWNSPGHAGAVLLQPSGSVGGLGWHKKGWILGASCETQPCGAARGSESPLALPDPWQAPAAAVHHFGSIFPFSSALLFWEIREEEHPEGKTSLSVCQGAQPGGV